MENLDQVVPDIDNYEYETLYEINNNSADFEYLGASSSTNELINVLSNDQIVPESVSVSAEQENLSESDNNERNVGSEDDTDTEIDVVGLPHDIINIQVEEEEEEEDELIIVDEQTEGSEFKHRYNLRKCQRHPRVFFDSPLLEQPIKKKDRRPYFPVEKILATRKICKERQYYVKFLDYGDEENQWVWAKDMTRLQ